MAQSATLRTSIDVVKTGAIDLEDLRGTLTYAHSKTWANGTGASQADIHFSDTRTIAASGDEDLDLRGILEDAFGSALNFVKVVLLYIRAADANTNSVIVSRPTDNSFPFLDAAEDSLTIPPGGERLFTWPVNGQSAAAGTGDLINVANSAAGTGVTYDIVILGKSA